MSAALGGAGGHQREELDKRQGASSLNSDFLVLRRPFYAVTRTGPPQLTLGGHLRRIVLSCGCARHQFVVVLNSWGSRWHHEFRTTTNVAAAPGGSVLRNTCC